MGIYGATAVFRHHAGLRLNLRDWPLGRVSGHMSNLDSPKIPKKKRALKRNEVGAVIHTLLISVITVH